MARAPPLTVAALGQAREVSPLLAALRGLGVVQVLPRVLCCRLPRGQCGLVRALSPPPCGRRLLHAPSWRRRLPLGPPVPQCRRLPVAETVRAPGIPAPPVRQPHVPPGHPAFRVPAWLAWLVLVLVGHARLARGLALGHVSHRRGIAAYSGTSRLAPAPSPATRFYPAAFVAPALSPLAPSLLRPVTQAAYLAPAVQAVYFAPNPRPMPKLSGLQFARFLGG